MKHSIFFKGVLGLALVGASAAFAAGCGDDDETQSDGSVEDSSTADVSVGDDSDVGEDGGDEDAGDVDAGNDGGTEDDASVARACSEEEEEYAETPIEAKGGGESSFYQAAGLAALICRFSKEPLEQCVLDALDEGSEGVIGEECGTCMLEGALCLADACEKICDDMPAACEECQCGIHEASESCVNAFEACAGYTPTICFPDKATL